MNDSTCPNCGTALSVDRPGHCTYCRHTWEVRDDNDDGVSTLLQQIGFKDPFPGDSEPAPAPRRKPRKKGAVDPRRMSPELAHYIQERMNAPPPPDPLPRSPLKRSFWKRIFGGDR